MQNPSQKRRNNVTPLRRPETGPMSLRDALTIRVQPTGDAPEEMDWTCEVCGPVPPFFVPFGAGHWTRGTCECGRARREAEEQRQRIEAWTVQQAARTFSWLGKGWEDTGLAKRTFETFDRKRQARGYKVARAFVAQVAAGKPGNLGLHGSLGTGKTHLVAAIANALREEHHMGSLFAPAAKLHAAYLDRLNHNEDHWQLIKQAIATPLLIIDDIDKPKQTETRTELYYMIFDERNKAGRPVVLTTNRLDTLPDLLGEAACSRFMEGLQMVEMVGGDIREER